MCKLGNGPGNALKTWEWVYGCYSTAGLQSLTTNITHVHMHNLFLVTVLEHENALSSLTESTSTSPTNHLLILTLTDKLVSHIGRAQNNSVKRQIL